MTTKLGMFCGSASAFRSITPPSARPSQHKMRPAAVVLLLVGSAAGEFLLYDLQGNDVTDSENLHQPGLFESHLNFLGDGTVTNPVINNLGGQGPQLNNNAEYIKLSRVTTTRSGANVGLKIFNSTGVQGSSRNSGKSGH